MVRRRSYLLFLFFLNFGSYAQTITEVYFQISVSDCDIESHRYTPGEEASLTDYAILKLPASYTASGSPTRLVYLAHGAGGGVSENSWFLNNFDLQSLLLANGYAVFDVNGGRVENMGGEFVVASAYKAWRHIVENYNVHPKIIVGGFSMGGLSSTRFVCTHSSIVLAHVMYSPVLDVYQQAWQNPWLESTRKAISEVYQFEDPSGERFDSCAVARSNPLAKRLIRTKGTTRLFYPVPVKIWHGSADKVVTVESSRLFYTYVNQSGGEAELVEIESDDHGLSCGNDEMNQQLVAYINQYK